MPKKNTYALGITISQLQKNIYKSAVKKDLKGQAFYTEKLARLYWSNKIYSNAISTYTNLLTIETKRGDRPGMMSVHENLGIIYRDLGKYKQSLYEFNLFMPIANQTLNKQQAYQGHLYIANVFGLMRRYKDAINETERAMWVAQSLNKNQRCSKLLPFYFEIL